MTDAAHQQGPWSLAELLSEPSEEVLGALLSELDAAVGALEAKRAELTPEMDPGTWLEVLRQYESLVEQLMLPGAYASLWFSADTQSAEALAFRNRVQQAMVAYQNRLLFLDLWWKGLSDAEAEGLMPAVEDEPDLRHHLEDLRRVKPFTLDESSEQIINSKDANGISTVLTLYSMLANRLEFELEVDGETRTMTRDELMSHVYSPDADLREAAYKELYRVFEGEAQVLGQIYVSRVRDWHAENVEMRGFTSPIAVRNVANDLPDGAVETLLAVCRRNAPLFQRYFKLKARWLGMEKLRRYDIYAPIEPSESKIDYNDAVEMVLGTFAGFHPDLAAHAERVFAEGHIDSEVRKGKRGGAFCATVVPRLTPWVLVNYTGKVRDVATLAHELGHAVHSMLAEDHSVLTQHPVLPLAETASVFSEMLLTDRLLSEVDSDVARRELLASAVDDAFATVMRQAFFVLFEQQAHQAIMEGASSEDLNALYGRLLAEQFGDSVELGESFNSEWVAIPHIFHTPFYCYAYSFGQLLVLALYRRFQEEGEAFKPAYLRLLAHGGSERPEAILAEAGIDVHQEAFWQGGFDVVEGLVQELEALD
jgi:oligoendopeptidase F